MKKILLTRSEDENIRSVMLFSQSIENKGKKLDLKSDINQLFLSSPALEIEGGACDFTIFPDVDALILTSANALQSLQEETRVPYRMLPTFVVGDKTGKKLQQLGFKSVRSFIDVEALSREIASEKHRDLKRILYLRGEDVSFDFTGSINAENGKELISRIVYRAVPAEKITGEAVQSLQRGEVGAIAFFSKRSATIFLDLIHCEGLLSALEGISPLCISASVLECVQSHIDGKAYIAKTPDLEGMLNIMVEFLRNDVQQ